MPHASAESGPRRSRIGLLCAALAAFTAALLIFASTAGADAITPESGPSQNANDIDTLYKIIFFMGLAVIGLVWTLLFLALTRRRTRRGGLVPQVRGNRPLELGWTAAAIGLVVAIVVITLVMLGDIKNPAPSGPDGLVEARAENAVLNQPPPPGGKSLRIKISGQQYFWRYQYPNTAVSFHDLVVPRDRTVLLDIESNDVDHSWWIPKLGGKADAIRGLTNHTWFKATKTGTYPGQCAEFCGSNHAAMTANVVVVEPGEYDRWVAEQKRLIQQARDAVAKQRADNQVPGETASEAGAGSQGSQAPTPSSGTESQRPGQGPQASETGGS
jgi:cytochrome c oxidase subunit II